MSDETPAVSPVDLYIVVLQALSQLPSKPTPTRDDVARSITDAIAAHGLVVYRAEGPKVRQATAIRDAREHLQSSKSQFFRTGAQAAMAEAMQGILVLLLEWQESQWDTPCDCFAGMPQLEGDPFGGFADAKPDTGKDESP